MNPKGITTSQVQAKLERERRINLHRHPIRIVSNDGTVTLEGEVADVAAKKLALELAGAVRDTLARMLLESPELKRCSFNMRTNEKMVVLRRVERDADGDIEISVTDGVVLLEGTVISQSHLRFAGAIAWWTPGRRDVINALEVRPAAEDHDEEVADVLRLVLEADPELDADLIRAQCSGKVVILEGSVPNEQQKRRAELDAWSLFAIKGVVNRLEVAR